jgi:hypothetical protein
MSHLILVLFFLFLTDIDGGKEKFSDFDFHPCRITSRLQGYSQGQTTHTRLVAMGDLHGCYEGMLEVLFHARVTKGIHECEWSTDASNTTVVQMGDIVDRGNGSLLVFRCLRHLQISAPSGSRVLRVLGYAASLQCVEL